MSEELRIRVATTNDLDAIEAIESAVFESSAWNREMLREEIAAEYRLYLVVVGHDETVLGYGGLLAVGEDGDIQTLALTPEARGTGQGRRLMNALLDEAARRRVKQVFLEVRADNPVARSLYISLGFSEIGRRPRYYQPEDIDAVVMRMELEHRR